MSMSTERILSGIRPTGRLHIGNYLGAVKNFVALQNDYECLYFIADLHSLNEPFDPEVKRAQVLDVAKDYLAAGLDPARCTLFVQSHVPAHSQLAIVLANVIPVSFLFRMTQYKDKSTDRELENINAGLLYYPVLMAADILLYSAKKVPVGQDQTQHVELTRDAARFFNNRFGHLFTEPEPLYTTTPKVMSLLAPDKKMAKSLGDPHCIYLDETPDMIEKKLARAVTDSGDGTGEGAKNLVELLNSFASPEIYRQFKEQLENKSIRYGDLKQTLATAIGNYFADFRKRKSELSDDDVIEILKTGAAKANDIAQPMLMEAYKKIGLR